MNKGSLSLKNCSRLSKLPRPILWGYCYVQFNEGELEIEI